MKVFRNFIFFVLLPLLIVAAGCGFGNLQDSSEFYDNLEEVNDAKQTFYEEVLAKITDENQKTAFSTDYLMVSSADNVGAIYYAVINMYELTPKLVEKEIQKNGDTYSITDENSVVKFKFDKGTQSSYLEISEGSTVTNVIESVKLSDKKYAYQLYTASGNEKSVIQFLLDGENGWISVNDQASSIPSTLYKKSSVGSTFGKEGTRKYAYENGNYTFTGNLNIPTKTVIGFTILSGIKAVYNKNENLNITGMTLSVSYDDFTTGSVAVTTAMVVGSLPSMTTTGTKTLVLTYGGVQNSFQFEVVEGGNQNKTVSDFVIKSGLKTSYTVDEEFDVTDLVLTVTYSDSTSADMAVTSAMVVGTLPDTGTAGQKSFTLKVGTVENTFNYTVTEATQSPQEKLKTSYDSFFNTLFIDFYINSTGKVMEYYATNKPMFSFFTDDFTTAVSGQWSNIVLLSEAVTAIKAHEDGNLGTLIFENPTENFGKTAYCTYNEATKTYNVGYWAPKQLGTLYWFEAEVTYDEVTDSLKAVIRCGVDDLQIIRGYVEYAKVTDGIYACMLYFPVDENNDEGKYNSFEFRFGEIIGSISENLWVEEYPESIYQKSIFTTYGQTGDKTFTVSGTECTFTDNLKSDPENFYNSFLMHLNETSGEFEYEGSTEDTFLNKVVSLAGEDYYFDPSYYSLSSSLLYEYLYLIADYDKKVFDFSDYESADITVNGDTTTFVLNDGYETNTFIFKYSPDKLSFKMVQADYTYVSELVQTGGVYYVQMYEEYDGFYTVIQNKYTDINNMVFVNFETDTEPASIYPNIPSSFITNYLEKYTVANGTLTYLEHVPEE